MILTVTLNPALDVTHVIDQLVPGHTHRVSTAGTRPGGKAVNVARVLHQLGVPVLATGLTGGDTGRQLRAALASDGVPEAFCTDQDPGTVTRRTVTLVERPTGRATVTTEPGPRTADWPALLDQLSTLMAGAELVVLSGSLPPAVPGDAYRTLVERAHRHGVPALVDADGDALGQALAAAPDLVKPNTVELRAATGHRDPLDGGRLLLARGARRVVVSDGPDGLTGIDACEAWHAGPAPLAPVNPTGAGDAAVAALAAGLVDELAWPDLLRTAVAWSAAAVLEPYAGSVATDRVGELARTTTVTPLAAPTVSLEHPSC